MNGTSWLWSGVARGVAVCAALAALPACAVRPGEESRRHGDEIVVAGRFFRTGAPVVLWTDPGGYDAYRVERRFVPIEASSWEETVKVWTDPASGAVATPNRYSMRRRGLSAEEIEAVRGGGWTLEMLQRTVDQFVLHYDVCGTSRVCFRVLHDMRGLSVHFLLDIDGTIYQTLDVKERGRHATVSNDRSVGIEIAHIGAYPPGKDQILERWYARDEQGWQVTLPSHLGGGGVRTPGFIGRPARDGPVEGAIHGQTLVMHDFTPEQYDSLIKLTAALCTIFPEMACDYPRDAGGALVTTNLSEEALAGYRGLLGHYHVQRDKIDPGPAMDWDRVVRGARRLLR
ncbi:MAG: N-acetylmuramoyl-L-alanine amidase [Phycisphaeraceae bacterium]|nr:MAG: N-acetylmuramoyl-L-alanine amidase [Phycisphaeraceae bacterium]